MLRDCLWLQLHAGLPGEDSAHRRSLSDISTIDRTQPGLDSVCGKVEPHTDRAAVSDILWSDPNPDPTAHGVEFNVARGGGTVYSGAYARAWLAGANLHTLIRSHQLVRSGAEQLDCGGGCSVWTVFSASNYPNHTGLNEGAVIKYRAGAGGLRKPRVLRYSTEEPTDESRSYSAGSRETSSLSALVHSHRYRLRRALKEAAAAEPGSLPAHRISVGGWAEVMGEVLRLEKVSWLALQPALAPTIQRFVPATGDGEGELVCTGTVNYLQFLTAMEQQMEESAGADTTASNVKGDGDSSSSSSNSSSSSSMTRGQDVSTLGALYAHVGLQMDQMQVIFSEIDANGDGVISASEFRNAWSRMQVGVPSTDEELNRLFEAMDHAGTGGLTMNEFFESLRIASMNSFVSGRALTREA